MRRENRNEAVNGLPARWTLCLALSLLALLATAWPDGFTALRYDRAALAQGEFWRVATAHFTHLGWAHLLFDLAGLALICELLWGDLPLRHGVGLLGCSAIAVGAGLWWLQPNLEWYVGLSGISYGLWSGCALYGGFAASRGRWFYAAALALLIARLAPEFLFGPAAGAARLIGGEVVPAAHLYGALAGAVYATALRCARMPPPSEGRCDRVLRPGSEVSP